MRRLAFVFAGLLLVVSSVAEEPDLRGIIQGLRSSERATRFEAIRMAEKLPEIPASLISSLVSFVQLEAEYALIAKPGNKAEPIKPVTRVSFTGEEVSLTRIKADPEKYIGSSFILCGALATDSFYSFGYADAVKTHYSFRLNEVTKDGKVQASSAQIYVSRMIGPALSERVTGSNEKGASTLVRLRCTIPKTRVAGNEDYATAMIEATEWQFSDQTKNDWQPWTFEGIETGFKQLRRAGRPAVQPLTQIVLRDQEYQNELIDTILRAMALSSLAEMKGIGKDDVASALRAMPAEQRSAIAKPWAIRLADALGIVTVPTVEKKAVAKADPELRAATLLRSAKTLEKSRKTSGALSLYREVIKSYPGTKSAEEASRRIKALGGK